MVGDIISEWWATSNRNGGRDHSGMVGDIERNQQISRLRRRSGSHCPRYCSSAPIKLSNDVACWPIAEVASHLVEVCLLRQGGLDLLRLSCSHFDPKRSSRGRNHR